MSDSAGRIVVVGAGIAGVSAAGAARQAGHEGEIVLIGDEPQLPYRRPPVSKEIVRGEKTPDEIRIRKPEWYEQQRIELRTGERVVSIDPATTSVLLESGDSIEYDRLLLATGGRARAVDGFAGAGLRTLRDLSDVDDVAAALRPDAEVVVVGAGLIGSEIAASARERGAQVTLLEATQLPLPNLLPPNLGEMYAGIHREHGTELHTGVQVASIQDGPNGETVVTAADGRTWSAPVVVLAVGMVPNGELAEKAGLETADGAIVVDELGRTSDPEIFAAGDVALMPSRILGGSHRVEHWQGAQNHGSAVGKAMAGKDEPFDEVPWCWSDQYGLTLQVAGWPAAAHETVVRGSVPEDFTAFFLDAGVIRGVVGIGRPKEVRLARQWIGAGARPDGVTLADDGAELAEAVAS